MTDQADADGPLFSLTEYRDRARRVLSRQTWDFIEGGALDERTLRDNVAAFARHRLRPRVLTGVREPDTAVEILGRRWTVPIAVAPMAYHGLCHPEAERATVAGATSRGMRVVVSCLAGTPLDELGRLAQAPLWLQLYVMRDERVTEHLVRRAVDAGCEALVVTVDVPRLGRRQRDLRNGFRLPSHIAPVNVLYAAGYADPAGHARTEFLPGLDWSVLDRLRQLSGLPLILKGVLTGEDGVLAVAHGADAVIVSNHGGRQLDGVPAAIDALPEVVAAVDGRCPVLMDGGVRGGRDVAVALALGARAVLVGRPVLHGLAVAGAAGVSDVLGLIVDELTDVMTHVGRPDLAALEADLLTPPAPVVVPSTTDCIGAEHVISAGALHASLRDPVLGTMNFLNEITLQYPDAISFAPGRPYEEFFDVEQAITDLRGYLDELSRRIGPKRQRTTVFQYGPTAGFVREHIAEFLLREEGLTVDPEAIVVTVGCQEAIFLALRTLFSGPNDVLLVQDPCYVGITGAARLLDIAVAGVSATEDGFSAAALKAARAQRAAGRVPRACYVVPDVSNPTGVTLTPGQRKDLLRVAAEEDLLILEDSPYRLFTRGPRHPTLKALDTDRRVVHLGSFAKSGFPGARLGFAVADQRVADAAGEHLLAADLAAVKSMVTVNTSSLSQAAIAGMLLRHGHELAAANQPAAAHYAASMRQARTALKRHFPTRFRDRHGVSWNDPDGGFFLTLRVPFEADDALLGRSARDYGVIWTPMRYFAVAGAGTEHDRSLRLSCSYLSVEQVDDGIARLAQLIRDELASCAASSSDVR